MGLRYRNRLGRGVLLGLLLLPLSSRAQPLIDSLGELLSQSEVNRSAEADLRAARYRTAIELKRWYPDLDLTLNYGAQDNFDGADAVPTAEAKMKLTQLLWDFGSTNAAIAKSRLQLQQKEWQLEQTRQQLLLDGATAYINLIRTYKVLRFARQSEENIRRQTGLEEIRVTEGMGFSTDLLQSQSQLAGAKSRRIQSESSYQQAENRFWELFGAVPEALKQMDYPEGVELLAALPTDLAQAITLAKEGNIGLQLARIADQQAQQELEASRADSLFPVVDFSLERSNKRNSGGTEGSDKNETIAKVELTMPFNLGGSAFDTIKATQADLVSRESTSLALAKTTEREVRDGWLKFQTAQAQVIALKQQADISAAFLELARRERELGNRSLLDVLSGETALINARSDSEAAQADTLLAALALLQSLGGLQLHLLR